MGNLCIGDSRKVPEGKGFRAIRGKINEKGEAKLIILGLDGAGKTAIYNKLIGTTDFDYREL